MLNALLRECRQEHIVAALKTLKPPNKERLVAQLESLDLRTLVESLSTDVASPEQLGIKPPSDIIRPNHPDGKKATEYGERALAEGRIAALIFAGGQGSRLGFDGPKGAFPVGPVSQHTLFQIHVERLLGVGQAFGCIPPLYIMTSPSNHADTISFLDKHKRFGFPAERLCVFTQGTLPVFSDTGSLLLAEGGHLVFAPDGNGGVFLALKRHQCFQRMAQQGVEHISVGQVDNPMTPLCEPRFIGFHMIADSEFSCKTIEKNSPEERVGIFAEVNGKIRILEYTELPRSLAEHRQADESFSYAQANPGIFLWARSFAQKQAETPLPIHRAHKKVSYVDIQGQSITPQKPNSFKLERFAMDSLSRAERIQLVCGNRDEDFAPVKNADGIDSPRSAQMQMNNLAHKWLRANGIAASSKTIVEISPRYAFDETRFKQRCNKSPPSIVGNSVFLNKDR